MELQKIPTRFSLVDHQKLIYRGGQPNEIHVQELHNMGIKNVINLRKESIRKRYYEKKLCKSLNINYHPFPHYGIFGVDTQFIHTIVDLMHNQNTPIYIHCKNGRDRTSLMVASYLVKYHGKDPHVAWKEDVLGYDHDESNIFYSKFKQAFFDFCNSLQHN